jgi:hypothetical protein
MNDQVDSADKRRAGRHCPSGVCGRRDVPDLAAAQAASAIAQVAVIFLVIDPLSRPARAGPTGGSANAEAKAGLRTGPGLGVRERSPSRRDRPMRVP